MRFITAVCQECETEIESETLHGLCDDCYERSYCQECYEPLDTEGNCTECTIHDINYDIEEEL